MNSSPVRKQGSSKVIYSLQYFYVLCDFLSDLNFCSRAVRKEHAGRGLEPQGKDSLSVGEQVERRGHGPWVESIYATCLVAGIIHIQRTRIWT